MFYVKHIHIDSTATLAAQTFSTTPTDDYIISVDNMIVRPGTPTIKYHDFCVCKPINSIYTHGQFYGEASIDDYQYIGSVYGVQWDTADPSPECTRIGNLTLHTTLPVQSQMIGGTMTDDGTFTPFINQSNWTSETRDGSIGQVMVKLPHFWWKFETVGTINKVLFSATPIIGFKEVKQQYVSAYEAALDRTISGTYKLSSVVNRTTAFRGGNNQSAWDSEDTAGNGGESHRTQLGRPVTNTSLTSFRTYARNRNAGDTRWNCMTYEIQKILYWLYVVEYATLNSQKAYDSSLTSEGYRQGGLGDGVTTWTDASWNSFNSYYPLVPCGWTDEFGNMTGVKNFTVYNGSGTGLITFAVPRYRGVENPFGHIWQWTDGVLVDCQSSSSGGKSPVYVCYDPSKFNSNGYGEYQFVANEFRTNNYVKTIAFGENGDIIGTVAQSSSSSYYCDYHYVNIPSSGTSLRGLRFGGSTFSGAFSGFVYSGSSDVPSAAYAVIGSRLCFFA